MFCTTLGTVHCSSSTCLPMTNPSALKRIVWILLQVLSYLNSPRKMTSGTWCYTLRQLTHNMCCWDKCSGFVVWIIMCSKKDNCLFKTSYIVRQSNHLYKVSYDRSLVKEGTETSSALARFRVSRDEIVIPTRIS